MKIGIFLGYDPQTTFTNEGLGRYLGGLIKGFIEEDEKLIIVLPLWLKDSLADLFQEFDISCEKIEFRVMKKVPFIWKVYNLLHKKKKTKKRRRIISKAIKLRDHIENILFTTNSALLFVAFIVGLVTLGFLFLIPFMIIITIGILANILKKLLRVLAKRSCDNLKFDIRLRGISWGRTRLKKGFLLVLTSVRKMLVKEANKECVDIWFVPALFWKETYNLKGVRVNIVPDMVTEKYAIDFCEDKGAINNIDDCREVIKKGKYFITYSEYVNKTTLQNKFHKYYGRAIPISFTNLGRWISWNKEAEKISNSREFSLQYAKYLLGDLKPLNVENAEYYNNYSLTDVEYVFYPSQVRPHKNMETLIRAVHYLIKNKDRNLKLVLTCNNAFFSERIKDFIKESGMDNNILCFHGVTVQQLAALYKCAKLVVNPSLYEGGFVVFTLGEGMSVGTPSVMGNMPQNMDVINDYPIIRDEAIFDSNDYMDMAKTIEWGLDNRDKLYRDELPLYEAYLKRDNRFVAHEYIEYFKYVLECEKKAI